MPEILSAISSDRHAQQDLSALLKVKAIDPHAWWSGRSPNKFQITTKLQDMSSAVSGLASNYDQAQQQKGRQRASSFPSPLDLFEDAVSSHLIAASAGVFKQCWKGGS